MRPFGTRYLLMAAAAVACSGVTTPTPLPVLLESAAAAGPEPSNLPRASGSSDSIEIAGRIPLNEPCYDLAATALLARDTLLVTLSAMRRPEACIQVLAAFDYHIYVRQIPPTAALLRLVYDRHGPPTFTETALVAPLRR